MHPVTTGASPAWTRAEAGRVRATWRQPSDTSSAVAARPGLSPPLSLRATHCSVRPAAWLCLLGHHRFGDGPRARAAADAAAAVRYATARDRVGQLLAGAVDGFAGSDLEFSQQVGVRVGGAHEQVDYIEHDVMRGESEHEFFAARPDSAAIQRRVLQAFVVEHRTLGYVQGMSGVCHLPSGPHPSPNLLPQPTRPPPPPPPHPPKLSTQPFLH